MSDDSKALIKELENLSNKINNKPFPLWNELPDLDLYMDQVILLMEKYLENYTDGDSKLITPSMINNYVKLGILPPPNKKRYSKEHIAHLLIICTLKQVLPIPSIKEIIDIQTQKYSIEDLLNNFSRFYQGNYSNVVSFANDFIALEVKHSSSSDLALSMAIISSAGRQIAEKILELNKEELSKKEKTSAKENKKESKKSSK